MSVPLPNPDSRTTDTIRAGLNHAARLLADLCSRNSEYRDAQAEVATFLAWILDDHPSFASQLDASGVTAYFARRLGRFLFLAVNQERLKAGYEEAVGQPVARPVETASNSGFVRAALRHALPRWSTEAVEDSIDDAIILLDSWKSQTEKSEIVKAQLARRYLVKELTPALQALRQRAKAVHPDTCFLVSPCDAPKALRTYICEKIAIVIPLAATFDESWIFHCKDSGVSFRELVIENAVAPPSIPVMMAFDSGRTLFDFEGLRERVFRHFRAELPVMYVSSRATVLVTYPFHQFAVENAFYSAVTGFQMDWENLSVPFERRVNELRRENLPRHVYVSRGVRDLTGQSALFTPIQPHPHWSNPSPHAQ